MKITVALMSLAVLFSSSVFAMEGHPCRREIRKTLLELGDAREGYLLDQIQMGDIVLPDTVLVGYTANLVNRKIGSITPFMGILRFNRKTCEMIQPQTPEEGATTGMTRGFESISRTKRNASATGTR